MNFNFKQALESIRPSRTKEEIFLRSVVDQIQERGASYKAISCIFFTLFVFEESQGAQLQSDCFLNTSPVNFAIKMQYENVDVAETVFNSIEKQLVEEGFHVDKIQTGNCVKKEIVIKF